MDMACSPVYGCMSLKYSYSYFKIGPKSGKLMSSINCAVLFTEAEKDNFYVSAVQSSTSTAPAK